MTVPISSMEQLLRETMAEFWRQNNLGQKYDVIRRALETAREMGSNEHVDSE